MTRSRLGAGVHWLALGGLVLVAGLVLLGVLLQKARNDSERAVERRFAQRAQVSAALTQSVFGAMGGLSGKTLVRRYGGPATVAQRHLDEQRREHAREQGRETGSVYSAVVDSRGTVIAGVGPVPSGLPAATAGRGGPLLSDVRSTPKGPVVDYSFPFESPTGPRRLVQGVRVQLLQAFLTAFVGRVPNPDGTVLVVADGNGKLLARTGPKRLAVPADRRLSAAAGLPGTTWRLRLTADRDRVMAGVHRATWLPWTMLAVLGVALLAGLWLCARLLMSSSRVRRTNGALRESEGKLRGLVEALEEAVIVSYASGEIQLLNASAKRLLGMDGEMLWRGPSPGWTVVDDDGAQLGMDDTPAALALATGEPQRSVVGLGRPDGSQSWLEVSARPLTRPGDGAPYAVVCSCTDVTQRHELEAHLAELADRDPLTGLWNRRRFENDVEQQLARCRRYGERAGLLVVDVDGFKQINDTFGHLTGDEVLRALAEVLDSRVRASDRAARLGGDEFAVLLINVSEVDVEQIATEMATRLADAGRGVQDRVPFSISMGVAMLDRSTASVAQGLGEADRAMYADKHRDGKGAPAPLIERPDDDHRGLRPDAELSSLRVLLAAVHARDSYTAIHSREVVTLARAVARRLGLDDPQVTEVEHVALLHDLGKIAVPDSILRKPGPLTPHEEVLMRQHPVVGAEILASTPELAYLAPAIRAEHERWDGCGYPDRLAGEDIPIASRITLVCDAFHAMTNHRPYRRAMSRDAARDEIRSLAGSQFCPAAAMALLEIVATADAASVAA